MIQPIPAASIPDEWLWIEPLVASAIEHVQFDADKPAMLAETRERLTTGQYEAAIVKTPEAAGVVVSELVILDGVKVLWLPFIAGRSSHRPRAFLRFLREMMGLYEELARWRGCEEIRIGGRAEWQRVFPDFEPFGDVPNNLRKTL